MLKYYLKLSILSLDSLTRMFPREKKFVLPFGERIIDHIDHLELCALKNILNFNGLVSINRVYNNSNLSIKSCNKYVPKAKQNSNDAGKLNLTDSKCCDIRRNLST